MELSQDEKKLIHYTVLPLKSLNIDEVIDLLKDTGIILYSKRNLTVYVADEIVRLIRRYRGKEVGDKYIKRVLKLLRDPQINYICKKHGIDRDNLRNIQIKKIINEGIGIRSILKNDMYKPGTTLSDKKKVVNDLVDKGLSLAHLKGMTLDSKIDNLVSYFNEIEKEEKVGISLEGYNKLLIDLEGSIQGFKKIICSEFELQGPDLVVSSALLDYNIKPREILEALTDEQLKEFCEAHGISTRGNEVLNILDAYKDSKNILLENYVNIAFRNLNVLKENGIKLKESELGLKFEELTRFIFKELGFNVADDLRRKLSSAKDKIDILISLNDEEVILCECKTLKERGYNKFSSVSRQIQSYKKLLQKSNLKVVKSLLIAPEFSDEFISDCELDYELNLSLIKAESLIEILHAFKANDKLESLPHNLIMRDVVIQEERIVKAMNK